MVVHTETKYNIGDVLFTYRDGEIVKTRIIYIDIRVRKNHEASVQYYLSNDGWYFEEGVDRLYKTNLEDIAAVIAQQKIEEFKKSEENK